MKIPIPISRSLVSVGSIAGNLIDVGQIDIERTKYELFWLTKAIPNQEKWTTTHSILGGSSHQVSREGDPTNWGPIHSTSTWTNPLVQVAHE